MNVLIVDDVISNCLILEKLVSNRGHKTLIAHNGQEAVDYVKNSGIAIHLIIMDVMMPIMDGFMATKIIKDIAKEKEIFLPIIIISALSDIENFQKGFEVGVDDYITKPINVNLINTKMAMFEMLISQNKNILENIENINKEHHMAQRILDYYKTKNQKHEFVHSYQRSFNQKFNGDNICCFYDEEKLRVLVCDAMGHGLPAALLNIVVEQYFYEEKNHQKDIELFLYDLNEHIYYNTHPEFYICAALIEYNFNNKEYIICNAGIPKIISNINVYSSQDIPLGISNDYHYTSKKLNSLEKELFVLTDGITETTSIEDFNFYKQLFNNGVEAGIDEIFSQIEKPSDDVTILYINSNK